MNFITEIIENGNGTMLLLLPFLLALITAFIAFPTIIFIAHAKQLVDVPDKRSVHSKTVPTLGGIGIFFAVAIVLTLCGAFLDAKLLMPVVGALIILFFLGVKDDILILSPKKKMLGQIIAALMVILITDLRITTFSGILGIESIPYFLSIGFTLFVFILIINAYNLIDGLDGLAGSVGLLVSLFYGFLFFNMNEMTLTVVSLALVGALIPFLYFNFSKVRKIFMGDTGSMVVGFLLAFQSIAFININQLNPLAQFHLNAPIIVLAILFFPLLDTLRIFYVRVVILKKHPFSPDKNHIHHHMLQLGLKHWQVTLVISIASTSVLICTLLAQNLSVNIQLLLVVMAGLFMFSLPFFINYSVFNKRIKLNRLLKKINKTNLSRAK
ncbi:UDP-N-acetylglucosaminyl 1-phosphate transferase [Formosa agariphila KMM 3901]|uniref:UDP-N-acetylglucosaminyl 1-phosphate transferase n=1 Tax=Formosa agariphila (strain DSM 15362 / KCTC 12365 / LMG 23005 / KMM 3901 / M-2Alg 35-1) TaxID=1347342 RepID=T2KQ32_FORAG|nr:MraY family glycosyltransferase [Formosa agariphila]CDF80618.1 UDP-N-acetylglucosaminyl 1-phosphate transferase [Formosa agariphila KMM 3901]